MSTDLQLRLDAFDRSHEPLCGGHPSRNGYLSLCYHCPFATRIGGAAVCEQFGITIRAREKYALRGWKEVRTEILERDGQRCTLCSGVEDLHVHHIDRDPVNDHPENLITLCGLCHARIHTELRRENGEERVARVLETLRNGGGMGGD